MALIKKMYNSWSQEANGFVGKMLKLEIRGV